MPFEDVYLLALVTRFVALVGVVIAGTWFGPCRQLENVILKSGLFTFQKKVLLWYLLFRFAFASVKIGEHMTQLSWLCWPLQKFIVSGF